MCVCVCECVCTRARASLCVPVCWCVLCCCMYLRSVCVQYCAQDTIRGLKDYHGREGDLERHGANKRECSESSALKLPSTVNVVAVILCRHG